MTAKHPDLPPEFPPITKDFMSMLVGGGYRTADSGQTLAVQLLVNGNVVRSLAGDNAGAAELEGLGRFGVRGAERTAADPRRSNRRMGVT